MFTGLVEARGVVTGVAETAGGRTVSITAPFAGELATGESVAVNGVCLTVTAVEGGALRADIGPETMRVTTLASLQVGAPVNLERALRADSRFGGHFVQGHVDGVGRIEQIREDGEAHWVTVSFPLEAAAYLIPKGSVAVDGISLTVAALAVDRFDVMIVPFTWDHTTLSARRPGDAVNLEFDMVGKYVARAASLAAASDRSRRHGAD